MSNLKRANELSKSIDELEYFLTAVVEFDEKYQMGIHSVNVILKKQVTVKCSILGIRSFGCGGYKQEIVIPDSIRNDIRNCAKGKLLDLKSELQSILK